MTKYRRKPIVVEAVQWFPGVPHPMVRFPVDPGLLKDFAPWADAKQHGLFVGDTGPSRLVFPGNWIVTETHRRGTECLCLSDEDFRDDYEVSEA